MIGGRGAVQYQFKQLTDVQYGFCRVCNRSMKVALVCKEIEPALGSFGVLGDLLVSNMRRNMLTERVYSILLLGLFTL